MRWFLRSKIHKATVTKADVNYVGSITIDSLLIKKVGLMPGEKVLVVSNSTGVRLETYVLKGKNGSGEIQMNGASALVIKKGEEIIIMGFELSSKQIKPKKILVDNNNKFVRYIS
jgi:aspartate 1-decarboxylase